MEDEEWCSPDESPAVAISDLEVGTRLLAPEAPITGLGTVRHEQTLRRKTRLLWAQQTTYRGMPIDRRRSESGEEGRRQFIGDTVSSASLRNRCRSRAIQVNWRSEPSVRKSICEDR